MNCQLWEIVFWPRLLVKTIPLPSANPFRRVFSPSQSLCRFGSLSVSDKKTKKQENFEKRVNICSRITGQPATIFSKHVYGRQGLLKTGKAIFKDTQVLFHELCGVKKRFRVARLKDENRKRQSFILASTLVFTSDE